MKIITYLTFLIFSYSAQSSASTCAQIMDDSSLINNILTTDAKASSRAVELTNEELAHAYSVISTHLSPVDRVELSEVLVKKRVYESKNYRAASWERTRRVWDVESFPLFLRSSNRWIIAFNLETQEVFVMHVD